MSRKKTSSSAAATRPMRVGIVTLGCDKNTVDNEYLAGLLLEGGCELAAADGPFSPRERLDAVVVTTCGFIDAARDQSLETIRVLAERKRARGNPRRLFVAGCLSQRMGEQMIEQIPEIDGLVGVGQFERMAEMILTADGRDRQLELAQTPQVDIYKHMRRVRLEPGPHAYLKIADGCNHACTFCSIPLMKGRLRSVPREILLDEARAMIDQGVKEINLVAQDLSVYGTDRWPDVRLAGLVRDLARLEGDFWIRCLYFYPGNMSDEFLEVLASEQKVLPYLDMPLQHLHPEVLRRMKRPFREVNTFELVGRMRRAVPDLVLRSTVIVGFPGETQAEHDYLVEGIQRLELDRLGAFEYSQEEGTDAATMPDQVPPAVREERWHDVMRTQAEISAQRNQRNLGREIRVLVEGIEPESGQWVGRSAADAPEIDAKVFLGTSKKLRAGQFVRARVVQADVYDLAAQPVE